VPVGCSLGTCAALGSDPMLRPVQRDRDWSCRLDFGVRAIIITSRVVVRSGLAYVSGTSHRNNTRWIYLH
jgi:hypothetical protein